MNLLPAPAITILLAVEAFLVFVAWVRVRPIHRGLGVGMAAANGGAVALGALELVGSLVLYTGLMVAYRGEIDTLTESWFMTALQVATGVMWLLVPLAHGAAGLATVACLAHVAGRLGGDRDGWAGDPA